MVSDILTPMALRKLIAALILTCSLASNGVAETVRTITHDDLAVDVKRDEPLDVSTLPESLRALDGARVRIRGYVYPGVLRIDFDKFLLTTETKGKAYGAKTDLPAGTVPLKHLVNVSLKNGTTA